MWLWGTVSFRCSIKPPSLMVNLDDVTAHHHCRCLALPTMALITAECVIVKTRGLSYLLQVQHRWQLTLTTSLPTICISVWHSPFPHNLWVQRMREPDNSEKVPASLVTFFCICLLSVASVSCGAGIFCFFYLLLWGGGGGSKTSFSTDAFILKIFFGQRWRSCPTPLLFGMQNTEVIIAKRMITVGYLASRSKHRSLQNCKIHLGTRQ